MIRALFRFVGKVIKWTFLLTLPVTIVPLFTAITAGILLSFWNDALVDANTDEWLFAAKDAMGDWGVGGGVPSFRQFQDTHNDFHTMRINSNDFVQKLDFMLPEQYTDKDGLPAEHLPLDKYADIENLVRDISPTVRCGKPEQPREQWVYLTHHGFRLLPWDEDFVYALNYAQGDRKLNQTGLYFAQCTGTASFLCGVWNTRTPALVHFLVEDEPLDLDELEEEGISYAGLVENLRPVTVRIIEFPLKGAHTGLPWTTFPSFQNQMLAIMTGDRLYEQFEPYQPTSQMMVRFVEYMDQHYWDNKHHFLHYVNELDGWIQDYITKPLRIEEGVQFMHAMVFILTANTVGAFIVTPWKQIKMIVGAFLGKPLRGDEILGDLDDSYSGEPANILDDLFGGFMGDMWANMESMSSKSVRDSVSATGAATPAPTS
jgi:hypothetical protein